METLPAELVSSILSWLERDRDFCRARAAHRCFCVSSDVEVERRLGRWRNCKAPADFCAVGLVEALEILVDRGAATGADCVQAAVAHGHLNVLRFFVVRGIALDVAPRRRMGAVRAHGSAVRPAPPPTSVLLTAILAGHADVVSFLCERGMAVGGGIVAIDRAAASGHLAVVELLHHMVSPRHEATAKAMDYAATGGHLDIVRFLHANRREGCTKDAMDCAAAAGHLGVVRWLHENRTEGCTINAMDGAAANGHIDVVRWLHENRSEGCLTNTMNRAAAAGHADVVRFLHANRSEGCTTDAMDRAAANNHFDVVRFLHANRSEGCTVAAMDGAAGGGHVDIVHWLHRNRSEGCTCCALNRAATNGHHEVVRFLHSQRTEGYAGAAINYAAALGHLAIVQYLCEYQCPQCERAITPEVDGEGLQTLLTLRHCVWNYYDVMTALAFAIKNGHWEVAAYAVARICHMRPGKTAPVAVNGGNNMMAAGTTAMVEYDTGLWALLAAVGAPESMEQVARRSCAMSYSPAVLDFAAYWGSLDSVRWLHEHRTEGCTTEAMDWAAINGHGDIVAYLHENRPEGCTSHALDTRHEHIRQFLLQHRPDDCRRTAQQPYRLAWLPS